MKDVNILLNVRLLMILNFFLLAFSLSVVSIFYSQLKKENKTIQNIDVDGLGITSFVFLGLGIIFSIYLVYHSYYSL